MSIYTDYWWGPKAILAYLQQYWGDGPHVPTPISEYDFRTNDLYNQTLGFINVHGFTVVAPLWSSSSHHDLVLYNQK